MKIITNLTGQTSDSPNIPVPPFFRTDPRRIFFSNETIIGTTLDGQSQASISVAELWKLFEQAEPGLKLAEG